MKKQVVHIISKGLVPEQFQELNQLFKRYDITCSSSSSLAADCEIDSLFESAENVEVIAVLRVESQLKCVSSESQPLIALIPAEETCTLEAIWKSHERLESKTYFHAVPGYLLKIQNEKASPQSEALRNRFVLKSSLLTYAQLDKMGLKHSAVGQAVSKFISDRIYYVSPIDLNFHPQNQTKTIDFTNDPADFLTNNPYFNNPVAVKYGITNLFQTVLNRGFFFRSAKNRREKNYWCPALNAGLPLTPKKDVIHEITYMAHDFGHFLIPDLIYAGNHSEEIQQIYVTYRMMSEAFTLVLADMVFVDSLKQSGFDYDYAKRRIYPVFQESELDLGDDENFRDHLRKLLKGSVEYCLRGDDSHFSELTHKYRDRTDNLDRFKAKYMKFFVEDFKWTKSNYDYFRGKSAEFKDWWECVAALRDLANLELETIEEFQGKIQKYDGDAIDRTFEELFRRVIVAIGKEPVPVESFGKRLKRAFFKYMMGQMVIFARYREAVPEAKVFKNLILRYLATIPEEMKIEQVDTCMSILYEFIDLLLERNLITVDDALTFKEVFPIFEPCYAFYEEKSGFYKDLATVSYESIYLS